MIVDITSYDKAARYPSSHGYEQRVNVPISIVVHSTSSAVPNTLFENEAKYLYQSAKVSAHYLIGKDGRIVQFLAPRPHAAWHAGAAIWSWQNQQSIGIELHHSVGDDPYPTVQFNALTWLVSDLMLRYRISHEAIETHGQIALPGPYKRKRDPHDWPYASFVLWRAHLMPMARRYKVLGAAVYQDRNCTGTIADWLHTGDEVEIDTDYGDGIVHLANGLGFMRKDELVAL